MKTRITKEEMLASLKEVTEDIVSTMGPGGRNVGIRSSFETIYATTRDLAKENGVMMRDNLTTKDGVTVARFIKVLMNKIADGLNPYTSEGRLARLNAFVASVVVEAANKTMLKVGDGTTNVCSLIGKLYESVMLEIQDCGATNVNFHEVVKGMRKAFVHFHEKIKSIKVDLALPEGGYNKKYLQAIATISGNNDAALGALVAEAVHSVGLTGSIRIMDSASGQEYFTKEPGYTYPAGVFMESSLVGEAGEKGDKIKLHEPFVLIINKKVDTIEMLHPIINAWQERCGQLGKIGEVVKKSGEKSARCLRSLVLVVADVEGSAMTTIQRNLAGGTHPIYLVRMPMAGLEREQLIGDLATVCGVHQVFSTMEGNDISRFGKDFPDAVKMGATLKKGQKEVVSREVMSWKEFGQAAQIILTRDKMTVVPMDRYFENQSNPIVDMQKLSKALQEAGGNDFVKERIARLDCGMINLYLHGNTLAELGDRRELADDAIKACMSAMKYGVVAGGGRAMQWVGLGGSVLGYDIGSRAVWKTLEASTIQILENSYKTKVEIETILVKKLKGKSERFGFNPLTDQVEDFFETGVLDPAQMPVSALENAISAVGELLKMDSFLDIK